jgi:DNA-binding response OmpR family regulator
MATILIVDAEETWRQLLKERLEPDGFEVLTASNGAEGLRIVEEASPDVVVTEARLPGMDGLDLMTRILDRHPRMRVVLHSSCVSYLDNFLSWAADACLLKSPDTGELEETVRKLLGGGQARDGPTASPEPARAAGPSR